MVGVVVQRLTMVLKELQILSSCAYFVKLKFLMIALFL